MSMITSEYTIEAEATNAMAHADSTEVKPPRVAGVCCENELPSTFCLRLDEFGMLRFCTRRSVGTQHSETASS